MDPNMKYPIQACLHSKPTQGKKEEEKQKGLRKDRRWERKAPRPQLQLQNHLPVSNSHLDSIFCSSSRVKRWWQLSRRPPTRYLSSSVSSSHPLLYFQLPSPSLLESARQNQQQWRKWSTTPFTRSQATAGACFEHWYAYINAMHHYYYSLSSIYFI